MITILSGNLFTLKVPLLISKRYRKRTFYCGKKAPDFNYLRNFLILAPGLQNQDIAACLMLRHKRPQILRKKPALDF